MKTIVLLMCNVVIVSGMALSYTLYDPMADAIHRIVLEVVNSN